MKIFKLPNGAETLYIPVWETNEPLSVWIIIVFFISTFCILLIHLNELHPRLFLVEICCIGWQAIHTPTIQDKIQLLQFPLLQKI